MLESPTSSQLREAIAELYRVFARYPLRRIVEGCPCCISSRDQDEIHSAPLERITINALGRYTGKAMSTWGTTKDYKHFLPRLCEFLVDDSYYQSFDCFAEKLKRAGYPDWPVDERDAFDTFLLAWLRTIPHRWVIEWKELGRLYTDLRPFLNVLNDAGTRAIQIYALETYREFYQNLDYNQLDYSLEQRQFITEWLIDERTIAAMRHFITCVQGGDPEPQGDCKVKW